MSDKIDNLHDNTKITASSKQIEQLKSLFPGAFDGAGRFMPHKLEEALKAEGADVTREGYKLDWLGKSYAHLLANLKSHTLLEENTEHNSQDGHKDSENILIQGDNLDVLTHLTNAYREQVKMIYIDPPYNTGSDGFVYSDDRKFTQDELMHMAGLDEDEAARVLAFTNKGSNSHSAWLTFMYPRLYIACKLLREDGVIFISIDDNEQAQLKLLCDDVFGEENFVASFVLQTNPRGRSLDKYVAKTFEYIICYSKAGSTHSLYEIPKSIEQLKDYNHKDDIGQYRLLELRNRNPVFNRENRPNLFYPIYYNKQNRQITLSKKHQDDIEILPLNSKKEEGCWTWSTKKVQTDIEQLVVKKASTGAWRVFRKDYIPSEGATTKEKTIWLDKNINHENGKEEIAQLFNVSGNKTPFSFPKSVHLVLKAMKIGSGFNDLILDFFMGSGTTGHAVMQLNAEDGGNRRYIGVQLDEPTDPKSEARKAGYDTIFEITRERLKRAAKKIKAENPEANCDFGFKEYRLKPLNEGAFAGYLDKGDTLETYQPFSPWLLQDEDLQALLTTWKVHDGLPLTTSLEEVDLGGYVAYRGADRLYFVHADLQHKHLQALVNRFDEDPAFTPRILVAFHHMFKDRALRELKEVVEAKNRKHLQLQLVQRF